MARLLEVRSRATIHATPRRSVRCVRRDRRGLRGRGARPSYAVPDLREAALDTADWIAVALQALRKRHVVDTEALAAVLAQVHPPDVVERAVARGLGTVCTVGALADAQVDETRRAAARQLLASEAMLDLLQPRDEPT